MDVQPTTVDRTIYGRSDLPVNGATVDAGNQLPGPGALDGSNRPLITLVRAPVIVKPKSLATHGPTPPIGLAYIAGMLRENGFDVALIDAAGEAIDSCYDLDTSVGTLHRIGLTNVEIVSRIDPRTAVLGVTNMFLHEWPVISELITQLRAAFPGALIVMGGENATAFAETIMERNPAVDVCVLGEGELTMLELCRRHVRGESLTGLGGIRHRPIGAPHITGHTAGQPVSNQHPGATQSTGLSIRMTPQQLPQVPRPAWDLVPLDNYWAHEPFFGVNRGRAMQILGTRGCPYQCSFCSSPQMWTTRFVVRDPVDVVDEMASYIERYQVENFNFVDLTAATNRKWTMALCDAIEDRLPGLRWQLPVGTRAESIDREVLQRLHDTGCRNVTFAPESGSERMRQVMNKRADAEHILDCIREGHEIGLRTMCNIVLGHPEERPADVWASTRFLLRAAWTGCDDTAVIMFCPYPGSADFDRLVTGGEHVMDEAAHYVGLLRSSGSHRSWNPRLGARTLRFLQLAMISAFYGTSVLRRPGRLIEFVRAQITGKENTYIEQMVRTRRTAIRSRGPMPSELGDVPSQRSAATLVQGR